MKKKLLNLIALCLFAGLIMGFIPAAGAQDNADQSPLLLIKVPDIEKLLGDVQNLMPPAQVSSETNPVAGIRMMLSGWIDPERSIVAGMVPQGAGNNVFVLLPFHTPNPGFQQNFNAVAREDYYLMSLPPQPQLAVSPAIENALVQASGTPATGSLVVEAAASRLLAIIEPMITESLNKMEDIQPGTAPPSPLSPQDMQAIMNEMLAIAKQADILRFGLDLSEEFLTVFMDIEARPNTDLSGVLTDIGGETRLMDYPIDMPIQFHTRAHNIPGMLDLMAPFLNKVYGPMGLDLDFDEMVEMNKPFTGEFAGGMNINSDGIAMEYIAVLQPGIDGETFIRDSYLPFLERYGNSVSETATEQTDNQQITMNFERTADSSVAGVRIMGGKTNIHITNPDDNSPFDSIAMETRIAAVDDLLFMASNDAIINESINKTRNLILTPANGPTGRFTLDLAALFKGIQTTLPPEQASIPLLENLGKITAQFDVQNGKLATRTIFNMEDIKKLVSALSALAAQINNNQVQKQ